MSTRPVRVVFFSHGSTLHGAERSLVELIKELKEKSISSHVVLPDHGPLQGLLEQEDISYDLVNMSWWAGFFQRGRQQIAKDAIQSLENLLNYLPRLKSLEPDLIYSNSLVFPWGAIAANQLEKPHIWHLREYGHDLIFDIPYPEVLSFVEDHSDLIITNSKALSKFISNYVSSEPAVIYNFIDVPLSLATEPIKSPYQLKDSLKIVILGILSPGKNQLEAVEALKLLVRDGIRAELLLVGQHHDNAYTGQIKNLVVENKLEDKVHLIQFVNNPYPYIRLSDIVLVPSKIDSFNRTVIEGILLNKVVVMSSEVGAQEIIVPGENGFVYQLGNLMELKSILSKLADKEVRRKIAEATAKSVQEFNSKRNYGYRVADLIRRTIAKGDRTPNYRSQYMVNMVQQIILDPFESDARIRTLTAQLISLEQAAPFRLLAIYRRVLDRIFRQGSWSRHVYDLIAKGVKSFLFYGPVTTWKRFVLWWKVTHG